MDQIKLVQSDRRQQPRYTCHFKLSPKNVVKDISLSGLRLESMNHYTTDETIPFLLTNERFGNLALNGEIVYQLKENGEQKVQYGIKFESITNDQKRILEKIFGELESYQKEFKSIRKGLYRLPRYGSDFLEGLRTTAIVSDGINEETGEIVNLSKYGCRISALSRLQSVAREIVDLVLLLQGERIYQGRAKVCHVSEALKGTPEYGFELLSASIDFDQIFALREKSYCNVELGKIADSIAHITRIQPRFKTAVNDLRYVLSCLKKHLDHEEMNLSKHGSHRQRLVEDRLDLVEVKFLKKIHGLIQDIESLIFNLSTGEVQIYREYYRNNLIEFFEGAEVMRRAFYKPLGYSGDYESVNIIYDRPRGGNTLWEKAMNAFLCNEPPAQAVRNRADYLYHKIEALFQKRIGHEGAIDVMSVACGPCKEVQKFMKNRFYDVPGVSFSLIDQEPSALEYAECTLKEMNFSRTNRVQFSFYSDSVKDILSNGKVISKYRDQDLIYSAGLFDYLSTSVAQALISALYQILKPGGLLVIGNFSPMNPSRILQEFGLDWYLTYRDETELKSLVPESLMPERIFVEKEEAGVNLFLNIVKPRNS